MVKKQKDFAQEYIKDFNAVQAAIRAGYSTSTAHTYASKLLKRSEIQREISALMQALPQESGVTPAFVVKELARIAGFDPVNILSADGSIKELALWPDGDTRVIASVDVQEVKERGQVVGIVKKVRVWDKIKALELLGRHLGMWDEATRKGKEDSGAGKVIQSEPLTPEQWEQKYGKAQNV